MAGRRRGRAMEEGKGSEVGWRKYGEGGREVA